MWMGSALRRITDLAKPSDELVFVSPAPCHVRGKDACELLGCPAQLVEPSAFVGSYNRSPRCIMQSLNCLMPLL
jgi:hypothetical protein